MDGSYDPSLQNVHDTFMKYDHAVPGVADAGAHGTILTDAVSNTSFLAHYVRDREAQMVSTTACDRLLSLGCVLPTPVSAFQRQWRPGSMSGMAGAVARGTSCT